MEADQRIIQDNRKFLSKISEEIFKRSQLYFIGSDPTRLKILSLLKRRQEFCVSELADILGISVSAASHQLSLMERHGLVKSTKTGKVVCYEITKINKLI